MSRISPPADRPIPTNEKTITAEQVSETETIQKGDVVGKAPLGSAEPPKEQPATESKGQQLESQIGGLARQTELQSQFPIPSGPTLKDLRDRNPNLDPNVHLDEKIDVTKNFPDGHTINKGLEGMDWGPSKSKTGPNHMGVDMTYGGMKAPKDQLGDVLNAGKPGQATISPQTGGGVTEGKADGKNGWNSISDGNRGSSSKNISGGTGMKRPGFGLVSAESGVKKEDGKTFKQKVSDALDVVVDVVMEKFGPPGGGEAIGLLRGPELVKEVTGDSADLLRGVEGAATGGNQVKAAKKLLEDDKTMIDPNADGGEPTAEDVARKVKVHAGAVTRGVNPDLGLSDPPMQNDPVKGERNFGVIDKNPDYIEETLSTPNLGNIAQPETRPDLEREPPELRPSTGGSDPNSNPS